MCISFLPYKFISIKVHAESLDAVERNASVQWTNVSQIISIIMNSAVVLCVLSVVVLALARPEETKYTDRYDNVDLDEILSNRRLLVPYVKCMLDQGKCAPDAKELKTHISDALENECAKCSEAQKKGTRRVIAHLINHEADFWNELNAKYDPERKYTAKYEKELKEIKA